MHARVASVTKGIQNSLQTTGVGTSVGFGERGGFTGIFEIVAADKARVGRAKRRPFCEPYLTLGTLAARSTSPPCRPKGRTGQRAMVNYAFVTDHPTAK
jgi:hypothetical protein